MTREFYPAISMACLQLHYHVIPFLPLTSRLSQVYGPQVYRGIEVKEGCDQTWSSCVCILEGHTSACYCVAFSPDGGQLVSGSGDHTIRLWNTSTGALLQVMTGHSDLVQSVKYSPDGNYIASALHDTTIRIWDAMSGLQVGVYTSHSHRVGRVAF